ncbi:MAG: malonate decarboxylase subunit alpha [Verrucomicrobiota bacterium]
MPPAISTATEAIAAIPSGATVAVSGFVGAGHPELLTTALEERFLASAQPRDLTLVYAAGQGDGKDRGLNHLAHEGLLKRVIGGHWNLAPKLGTLALENKIEAYNFPQGVVCQLFREIAGKRPGVITKVGLNTFIDPNNEGGRLNQRTKQELIERLELDGETWLRYRSFPITVALIRATSADPQGNLSVEHEGLIGDILPIAQAARNHGGIVIAQVERIVERISDPKAVRVPGILVDFLVESPQDKQAHQQTFAESFNPAYVTTRDNKISTTPQTLPFSCRKIIGRRALEEIRSGDIVNLGIGMPEAISAVAAEAGRLEEFTLTLESGPIGGEPASGLSFGCSSYPDAIIDQPSQFDFYDGGGIDLAALGAIEIDQLGNVNITQFGNRFAGVGGFVNITQNARRVIFCAPFRVKGLTAKVSDGNLTITSEGQIPKFVKRVQQVAFHGPSAIERGQEVLYVTERAVFRLTADGLALIETAPGIDLQEQILDQMEFQPLVDQLTKMPSSCFDP